MAGIANPFILGPGCKDIEVARFTPICSFDGVGGSEPLALDVPVVPFVPPVPPPECACFTFVPGEIKDLPVTLTCEDTAALDIKVEIVQSDTDCCTGKYRIQPTASLTLPCIPFEVADADVQIMRHDTTLKQDVPADSEHPVDGSAAFSLTRGRPAAEGDEESGDDECCTLKPTLVITFPDCIKPHDPSTDVKTDVTYCERDGNQRSATYGKVVTRNWKFLEWVDDPEHCTSYPVVHPLNLPCCTLPDETRTGTHEIKDANSNRTIGSLSWTWRREDCTDSFDVRMSPLSIPIYVPPSACASPNGKLQMTVTYTDDQGDDQTIVNGDGRTAESDIAGSIDTTTGCLKYDSSVTLNLGKMLGVGFNGGGGVNMASDGTLHVTPESNNTIVFHGGGFGDWRDGASGSGAVSPTYLNVFRRGPYIRYTCDGEHTDPSPYLKGTATKRPVPYEEVDTYFHVSGIGDGKQLVSTQRKAWEVGGLETGSDETTWVDGGRLNVVIPSGVQWSKDGLGLSMPFIEYEYSGSGLLTSAEKSDAAARVSPGPAFMKRTVNKQESYYNCSGLVSASAGAEITAGIADGLRVNTGYGLVIYGYGASAQEIAGYTDETTGEVYPPLQPLRIGSLEVMHGIGLCVRGPSDEHGEPTWLDEIYDDAGALDVMYGPGLHACVGRDKDGTTPLWEDSPFGDIPGVIAVSKHDSDLAFTPENDQDGAYRLAINDAVPYHTVEGTLVANDVPAVSYVTQGEVDGKPAPIAGGAVAPFARDSDFTIPAVMFVSDYYWEPVGGTATTPPRGLAPTGESPMAGMVFDDETESFKSKTLTLADLNKMLNDANAEMYITDNPQDDPDNPEDDPPGLLQACGILVDDYSGMGSNDYQWVGEKMDTYIRTTWYALKMIVHFLQSMRGTYAHISQAGTMMAADGNRTCAGIPRHAAGNVAPDSGTGGAGGS